MNILICAHDRPNYINGPNVWLKRVLPGLRSSGIESELLFFILGNENECATVSALRENGFKCTVYNGRNYTEDRVRWILEETARLDPDIFIPNLDIPAYHAASVIKQSGIPTVGLLHSDDPFYHGILEEFAGVKRDSSLSAIVAVSAYLEKICNERLRHGSAKIFRIPYGVPVPEEKCRYSDNPFQLIYAGRLVEKQKRISDACRAACLVAQKLPQANTVFYGSGGSESAMKKIVEEMGALQNVHLGGRLTSEELEDKMLESQVFMLLSDFEGLPIALMEAMACGLVPVCYNMESGIPELVEDGVTGLTVNDREGEFLDAVQRLVNEPKLWMEISKRAREKIVNGYSIQNSVEKWTKLIRELAVTDENGSESHSAGKMEIPARIKLPEKHPGISNFQDPRYPGYLPHLKRRLQCMIKSGLNQIQNN